MTDITERKMLGRMKALLNVLTDEIEHHERHGITVTTDPTLFELLDAAHTILDAEHDEPTHRAAHRYTYGGRAGLACAGADW